MENNDEVYECEILKNDKSKYKHLLYGTPKKYWVLFIISSILLNLLVGVGISVVILILTTLFDCMFGGPHDKNPWETQHTILVCFIVAAIIVSIIDIIVFIIICRDSKTKHTIRSEKHLPYAIYDDIRNPKFVTFGQSEYNEKYAKKARMFIFIGAAIALAIGIFALLTVIPVTPEYDPKNGNLLNGEIIAISHIILKCVFVGMLHSILWSFFFYSRNPVAKVACPKCNYVNTYLHLNTSVGESSHYDIKKSSTKSGEQKTHSVYVNGKEVGGIYERYSGYDTYSYGTATDIHHEYRCSKCGNVATYTALKMKEEGTRTELNNR
ncbi:MAG: hypothetical protein J1G38_02265 [Clostridiales bacterium]|nr:hypothetical protein [Clostridiales bacterium]